MTEKAKSLLLGLAKATAYAVITVLILIAVSLLLSQDTIRERQETNQNVRELKMESRKNREVLCLAVIRNPTNVAHDNPRILELCAEIGIKPLTAVGGGN